MALSERIIHQSCIRGNRGNLVPGSQPAGTSPSRTTLPRSARCPTQSRAIQDVVA